MGRTRNARIAAACACAAVGLLAAVSLRRRRREPAKCGAAREAFLADRRARMQAARRDLLAVTADVAS